MGCQKRECSTHVGRIAFRLRNSDNHVAAYVRPASADHGSSHLGGTNATAICEERQKL